MIRGSIIRLFLVSFLSVLAGGVVVGFLADVKLRSDISGVVQAQGAPGVSKIPNYTSIKANLKMIFTKGITVENGMNISGDIEATGSNLNLGGGNITAANIIYSLTAGDGVSITGNRQNPTIGINNVGSLAVTSIEEVKGDVDLVAGDNVTISKDGNKITIKSSYVDTNTSLSESDVEGYVYDGEDSALFLDLDVGNSTFVVGSDGNLSKIKGVSYVWPSSQGGASTFLQNDGSGNLSWVSNSVSISPDSLDFTYFADAMTLDATTSVAMGGYDLRFTGTGGTPAFVVTSAGNVGIGTSSPDTALHVNAIGVASTAEDIAKFTVSDDPTSYISIRNNSTTDSLMAPMLRFRGSGNNTTGVIQGLVSADTGSSPGLVLVSQLSSSALSTRPILAIRNYTTDLLLVNAAGNVGIGTTSPTQTLHVSGSARITGALYDSSNSAGSSGMVLSSTGTGTTWAALSTFGIVGGTGTDNYLARWNSAGTGLENGTLVDNATTGLSLNIDSSNNVGIGGTAASTRPSLYVGANGNVGIGSTSPGYKLDVNGTTNLGSDVSFSGSSGALMQYGNLNGLNPSFAIRARTGVPLQLGANNSYHLVINTSGNVGIGTTSPSQKLDVVGDIRIQGTNANFTIRESAVDSNGARGGFYSGITNGYMTFDVIPRGSPATSTKSNISIFNTDFVADSTNFERLVLSTFGTSYGIASGKGGTGSLRPIYLSADNGTSQLFLSTSGNVGIGTTAPIYKLDVNGAVGIGTTAVIGGGISLNGDYISDLTGTGLSNAGGSLGLNTTGVTAGTYGSSSIIPVITVDAQGRITAASNQSVSFDNYGQWILSAAGSNNNIASGSTVSFTGSTGLGVSNSSGAITLYNSGVTSIAGTTNQITASASTGAVTLSLPQDIATSSVVQFGGVGIGQTAGGIGLNVASTAWLRGSTANSGGLYVNGSGNVGIGTTSPTTTLQVAGSITATQYNISTSANSISLDGSITRIYGNSGVKLSTWNGGYVDGLTMAGSTGNIGIGTTGSSTYKLYVNGTLGVGSTAYFDSNVGIGTTAPAYRLDVNGAVGIGTTAVIGGGISLNGDYISDLTGTGLSNAGGSLGLNTTGVTAGTYGSSSIIPVITVDAQGRITAASNQSVSFDNYGQWVLSAAGSNNNITSGSTVSFTGSTGLGVSNSSGAITLYNSGVTSIAGTTNQITASASTGAVTLSLPQDIATSSVVQFGGVGIGQTAGGIGLNVASTAWLRGSTANSGGLFVNGSGNVGVGTTTIGSNKLVIQGDGAGTIPVSIKGGLSQSGKFIQITDSTEALEYFSLSPSLGMVINEVGASSVPVRIEGDSDANLFYTDSVNDRVGIGLATPSTKLHISSSGNVYTRIQSTNSGAGGIQLYSGSTANWQIDYDNPNYDGLRFVDNGTERLIIKDGGSVGIGTTSPLAKLDVAGTSWLRGSTANSGGLYVNSSGNVGIGTTSPSVQFQIAQASQASTQGLSILEGGVERSKLYTTTGSLTYLDFNQNTATIRNTASAGALNISTNRELTLSGTDDGTGSSTVGITLKTGGADRLKVDKNGNVGIATTSPLAKLDVAGTSWLRGSTANSGGLYVNGSGNVGIGTTSPTQALHVAGNAYITGALYDSSNSAGSSGMVLSSTGTGTTWAALSTLGIVGGTGTDNYLSRWNSAGTGLENGTLVDNATTGLSLNIDSSNNVGIGGTAANVRPSLYVGANGNVGIGTTAPGAALDVNGTTSSVDRTSLILRVPSAAENYGIKNAISFKSSSNEVANITAQFGTGVGLPSNLIFSVMAGYSGSTIPTATEVMRITGGSSGSVGIGTTSPLAKLDVAGTSWLRGSTANSGGLYVNGSGNVGIGTTAPLAILDVAGNALIGATRLNLGASGTEYPSIGYNVTYSGTANTYTYRNSDSATLLRMGNGSGSTSRAFEFKGATLGTSGSSVAFTDLMTIRYDGNVGIGTTSPQKLLEISGLSSSSVPTFRITDTNNTVLAGDTVGALEFYTNDASTNGTGVQSYIKNLALTTAGTRYGLGFGVSNGSLAYEAMRITETGNVGIGTTAPSQKLHVAGNAYITGALYDSSNSAGSSGMVLSSTGTGTTWASLSTLGIVGGTGTDNYLSRWNSAGTGLENGTLVDNATTGLSLNIDSSNNVGIGGTAANVRPSLYVGANGNVGIGTTAPSSSFDVVVGGNNNTYAMTVTQDDPSTGKGLLLRHSDSGDADAVLTAISDYDGVPITIFDLQNKGQLNLTSNANNNDFLLTLTQDDTSGGSGLLIRHADTAGEVLFRAQADYDGTPSTVFELDADGDVYAKGNFGIGTTSPLAKLDVAGTSWLRGSTANSGGLYVNGSGNVGIGTTSPSTNLEIAGTTNFGINLSSTQNSAVNWINFGENSVNAMGIEYDGANDELNIWDRTGSTSKRFTFERSGNLGIGTTAPSQALHVVGSARITGALYDSSNSAGSSGMVLSSTGTGTTWASLSTLGIVGGTGTDNYLSRWNSAGTGLENGTLVDNATSGLSLNIDSSNNVGIGGTSANVRPSLYVGANGNVGIGTTAPSAQFEVEGSSIFSTSSTVTSGNDSIYLDKNGLTSGQNNFGASIGFSRLGANLRKAAISSVQTGSNANQTGLAFFGSSGTSNADSIEEFMRITHAGNVGIGTTSPSTKLHVDGGLQVNNAIYGDQGILSLASYDPGTTTSSILSFFTANGSSTGERLRIDATGNVGIGTTAPSLPLSVGGNAIIGQGVTSGISQLYLGEAIGLADKALLMEYDHSNNLARFRIAGDTSPLGLNIANGGNVGIGTTVPTSLLNISGASAAFDINATGATENPVIRLFQAGTRRSFIQHLDTDDALTLASEYGDMVFKAASSAGSDTDTEYMRIKAGGNVGIGTTLPTSKLHVIGNINIGQASIGYNPDTSNFSYSSITYASYGLTANTNLVGVSGYSGLALFTANAERVRVDSSGNVGIGTTAPNNKFEVSGSSSVLTSFRGTSATDYRSEYYRAGSRIGLLSWDTGLFGLEGDSSNSVGLNFRTGGADRLRILTGGSVGIGTTNPESLLHLNSDANSNSRLKIDLGSASSNKGIELVSSLISNGSYWIYTQGDDATDNFVVRGDGYVGIGTTTPTQALHVVGSARITGALYDSSNSAGSSGMVLSSTGTGTTWAALSTLGIVGGTGTDNYLSRWNSAGTGLENGTLVDNATSGLSLNIDSSNNVGIGGTFANVRPSLYVGANGNVGIGTTAPTTSLQIGSGGTITNFDNGAGGTFTPSVVNSLTSGVAGMGVSVNDGTNNRRAALFVNQTSGLWGLSQTFSSANIPFVITSGGNERLRIDTSGRFGIGTTAPSTLLSLGDTTYTFAVSGLSFGDGDTGLYESADDKLNIRTNGSDRLTILSDGSLGIGTTNPSQKLEIVGNQKINTGSLYVTPGTPIVAGTVADSTNFDAPQRVAVQGKYAYVTATGNNTSTPDSFSVIDISNPSTPVRLSTIGGVNDADFNGAQGIVVNGNYAYVAASTVDQITVIDISNPYSPSVVGRISSSTQLDATVHIYIQGRYLYAAAQADDRITVVDISDPTNPTIIGSSAVDTTNSNGIYNVKVQGKYAYTAIRNGSDSLPAGSHLQIFDISNPTAITSVGIGATSASLVDTFGIDVSGRYAYLTGADSDSLVIYDVSNPASPAIVGTLVDATNLNGAHQIVVSGKYAYISAQVGDRFTIVDVSNPASPTVHASYNSSTNMDSPIGLILSGRYAYVIASTDDMLTILDIGSEIPSLYASNLTASNLHVEDDAMIRNNILAGGSLLLGGNLSTRNGLSSYYTSTAATAGTEYGNRLIITDTGAISSGTDTTYGLHSAVTRTGASGGILNTYGGYFTAVGSTAGISTSVGLYASASGADNNYAAIFENGNVGIGTTAPGSKLSIAGLGSSTGTALVIDANGDVWKDSSSLRYKEDVQPLTSDFEKVLELQPVSYRFKGTDTRTIGYIAEDLHERGLTDLVVYDQEGKPDAIKYDRLSIYLLEIVKKQAEILKQVQDEQTMASSQAPRNDVETQDVMQEKLASMAATLASLKTDMDMIKENVYTASLSALLMKDNGSVLGASSSATLSDLIVSGETNVNDLAVVGEISSGLLKIQGLNCNPDIVSSVASEGCVSEISTISGPLVLQSEAQGPLSLMAGKVQVDIRGNIHSKAQITVKKVNIDTSESDSASAGETTLPANTSEITIATSAVTGKSLIQVTFTGDYAPATRYWIESKKPAESFTLKLDQAVQKDVDFSWMIVN